MILNMNLDVKFLKDNSILVFLAITASCIYLAFPYFGQVKLASLDGGIQGAREFLGAVMVLGFLSFAVGAAAWTTLFILEPVDAFFSKFGAKYATAYLFMGSVGACICYVALTGKGKGIFDAPVWLYGYMSFVCIIFNARAHKPVQATTTASVTI